MGDDRGLLKYSEFCSIVYSIDNLRRYILLFLYSRLSIPKLKIVRTKHSFLKWSIHRSISISIFLSSVETRSNHTVPRSIFLDDPVHFYTLRYRSLPIRIPYPYLILNIYWSPVDHRRVIPIEFFLILFPIITGLTRNLVVDTQRHSSSFVVL